MARLPPRLPGGRGGPRAAFHALVEGRVQGVGFRYSARREALRLDLKGWVRNLEDGSVEIYAEGEGQALDSFADWLRQGPPGAWVQDLRLRSRTPSGEDYSFEVRF